MYINCKTNEIDIARIQETHNGRNGNQVYGDYAILYIASVKAISNQNNNNAQWANNWRGGVALLIKNDYVESIKQINRIRSRIVEIRLKICDEPNCLSITFHYAPYMGYGEIELNTYRNELNNHMRQIQKSCTKLWMTDNNGPISQAEKETYIIGKLTIGHKTEVGNGGNFAELRRRQDLTCTNTSIRPKMGESKITNAEFESRYRCLRNRFLSI